MKALIFKTQKLAKEYISENYPNAFLRNSSIGDRDNYDFVDMSVCWSGEVPAWDVEDENYNTVATIGWWEEGDGVYELFVGDKLVATFDNMPDALEAKDEAIRIEEEKDEDEEIVFAVTLLCNGEQIGD